MQSYLLVALESEEDKRRFTELYEGKSCACRTDATPHFTRSA